MNFLIKKGICILGLIAASHLVFAQETEEPEFHNPPLNVEAMFAHNGLVLQTTADKKLKSIPKLGYFMTTSFISDWNENKVVDVMHQSALTYRFMKNFDFVAGFQYTEATGFRGSLGLFYTYVNDDLFLFLNPRFDVSKNNGGEMFGIIQYTPAINEKWNFYSRVQGLYNIVMKTGKHDRSFLELRSGVQYKEFTFGLGANFDYFGPERYNVNNYGVFVAADLF